MSKVSKKTIRKAFRKRRPQIVAVVDRYISPEEAMSLYPEKMKRAKETLSKADFKDSRFTKPKLYI